MSFLEQLDVVSILLIVISFASIIFSIYNLNLIRKYLIRLKEKSKLSTTLKYTKYFILIFILANMILYLGDIFFSINLSLWYGLLFSLRKYLYLIITFSALCVVYFIYHAHTNDAGNNPLFAKFENRLYFMLGVFGLLFLYLLYTDIVSISHTRFLGFVVLMSILVINYFVYKIYNVPASMSVQNLDNDLSLLTVVLDIYILVFYISAFVFPTLTSNYVNYSPIFFFFVNLMIHALSKKNLLDQDRTARQIEKTENVLYINHNLETIKPALSSVTGVLIISRKNPQEIEDKGLFKDIANKEYVWLTEATEIIDAIDPKNLEKLLYKVTNFMKSSYQVPAIILDDLGYIKDFNGFKKTLRFTQDIRDHCQSHRIMFLCNIPSVSFDMHEISYFIKDFNIVNEYQYAKNKRPKIVKVKKK